MNPELLQPSLNVPEEKVARWRGQARLAENNTQLVGELLHFVHGRVHVRLCSRAVDLLLQALVDWLTIICLRGPTGP